MKKVISVFLVAALFLMLNGCLGQDLSSSNVSASENNEASSVPYSSISALSTPYSAISTSSMMSSDASVTSAATSVSNNSTENTKIQLFLQKLFDINIQGYDLNKLSDDEIYIIAIKIMDKNKEYTKDGYIYWFSSAKINEYARLYFQKTNFQYTKSTDQFTYDATKNGFSSTLAFGLLDDSGPQCTRTIEVTDTTLDNGNIIATCLLKINYQDKDYSQNNTSTEYKIVLTQENATYCIEHVN